jgi:HSP20 family protein
MSKTKSKNVDTKSASANGGDSSQVVTERREEVQDWFDRWADQFGMRLPDVFGNRLPEFWGARREMGGVMRIEETADDQGVTIRGEIPGIDPDNDVEITVDNGRLNIKAERRQQTEEEADGRTRSEFRYGSYRRSCDLPAGASADDIEATYKDGILEIRIPIDAERSDAARIKVSKG